MAPSDRGLLKVEAVHLCRVVAVFVIERTIDIRCADQIVQQRLIRTANRLSGIPIYSRRRIKIGSSKRSNADNQVALASSFLRAEKKRISP